MLKPTDIKCISEKSSDEKCEECKKYFVENTYDGREEGNAFIKNKEHSINDRI